MVAAEGTGTDGIPTVGVILTVRVTGAERPLHPFAVT